jgi:CheY-like chemotaxis protein
MASLQLKPAETILVVDDDPDVLAVTVEILRLAGYTVLGTVDPYQAIRLARNHAEPFDLLLTEVVMPLMGGLQLATEVRALRPGLKALLMFGYRTREIDDYRIRESPGGLFLDKPFTSLHSRRNRTDGPGRAGLQQRGTGSRVSNDPAHLAR